MNRSGPGGSRAASAFVFVLILVVPFIVAANTLQEVRIRWDAYPASSKALVRPETQQPSNVFTLLERQPLAGSLPRQRNPQLSPDHIVIIAVNAHGQETYRYTIPDPRIVRGEFTGPTGELRGEVLHRASTELRILLPDDPTITEVRLYLPRWTGTEFILDPLGVVALPEP
jgi:hypothetical protein